jgi:hypothetical protein
MRSGNVDKGTKEGNQTFYLLLSVLHPISLFRPHSVRAKLSPFPAMFQLLFSSVFSLDLWFFLFRSSKVSDHSSVSFRVSSGFLVGANCLPYLCKTKAGNGFPQTIKTTKKMSNINSKIDQIISDYWHIAKTATQSTGRHERMLYVKKSLLEHNFDLVKKCCPAIMPDMEYSPKRLWFLIENSLS